MAIREDSLSRGAMFYLPPTPLIPLPQRRSCLPIRHHSLGRGIRFFEGDGESGALTVPLKKPYLASVFGASYGLPMLVERGQLLCPRSPPIKDEPDLVIPPAHLCLPVLVLFKGARCRQAAGQGAGPAGALAL